MNKLFFTATFLLGSGLVACGTDVSDPIETSPVETSIFASLCGQTYQGSVVSEDPKDADWHGKTLVIGPVNCANTDRVEIPLAVGEDQSRTWVLTGAGETLELRHIHTLKDGGPDPVSEYGGQIVGPVTMNGTALRMDFPADAKTRKVFGENGLEVSFTNVWTLEMDPQTTLLYQLRRENRDFRALFDLSNPL